MASAEPYPSPPPSPVPSRVDPILRNVLRYTVSAKEYKTLHDYLITRSPPAVRKRAPPPARVNSIARVSDDHNAAAIRASLRVFIVSQIGLQVWDQLTARIFGRGNPPKYASLIRSRSRTLTDNFSERNRRHQSFDLPIFASRCPSPSSYCYIDSSSAF